MNDAKITIVPSEDKGCIASKLVHQIGPTSVDKEMDKVTQKVTQDQFSRI